MKPDYNHYFAKIKDVYLELPGFSYFHSPSGRFRDNPKMVGRKRVKRKLYGLLTNSETKTGSYIITGFRGAGKTSLVNQVINKLQPRTVVFKQALSVMISWGMLHFAFEIMSVNGLRAGFVGLVAGILYISNRILNAASTLVNRKYIKEEKNNNRNFLDKGGFEDHLKRINKNRKKQFLNRLSKLLFRFSILGHGYYKNSYAKKVTYFLFYASAIEIITYQLKLWGLKYFDLDLDLNLGWAIVLYITIILFSHFCQYLFDWANNNKGTQLRVETEAGINLVKQKINHSQKIFVRLSFPHESVNSKDILKLLVQNMYKEYQRYNGFNFWVSRIVISLIVVLMSSGLYSSGVVHSGIQELKKRTFTSAFLPSQSPLINDSVRIELVELFSHSGDSTSFQDYKNIMSVTHSKSEDKYEKLRNYTVLADYYVYLTYVRFYNFLRPLSNGGIIKVQFLPNYPDFVFFFTLMLLIGASRVISRLGASFGLVTNHRIKNLLKELNEKCLAEIGRDNSNVFNSPMVPGSRLSLLSIRRTKNLRYPVAGARDIENDLIRIFDELDRIPKIFAPPEFTFVFDELDKVQSNSNDQELSGNESLGSLESEKARRKRDLVSSIMANMKIFFTTAKAKFIFIAGREMYDASLADSSDRESYFGSIFHNIIYVSSLYKDPFDDHSNRTRKPVDITYWTERYVCARLIPDRKDYKHNLTGYSKYIKGVLNGSEEDENLINRLQIKVMNVVAFIKYLAMSKGSPKSYSEYIKEMLKGNEVDENLIILQHRKVMNVVTAFINYLAFRSKGSPMNMVKLFEEFAEEFTHKKQEVFDDREKLIIGSKDPKSFYLSFDFHAQYRISLVGGIFRPLVIEAGIHMKKYSDKILVSTSYLLDHIYKFHEFGFSWRNLELLPEIIDINRAPLLRRHVQEVLGFLSDSHVKRIENGFVNFKFHRKVIEEINYLSRSNDAESAIFNFTLDESNGIKNHYRERLDQLIKDYKPSSLEFSHYPYSIGFLESVLGDLHFFDKEYDEAILYYSNAVQSLKERNMDSFSLSETFVYTRIMLKEALVYERMNTYEPALIKYSELSEIIRRNGKSMQAIGEEDWHARNDRKRLSLRPNRENKETRLDFHYAKSMYENFSIMLLPILARLVAIEKISKQGITLKDSRRADRDFHGVFNYLKKDEKYLLKVEYHLQKGNILFFKNGVLYRDYSSAEQTPKIYGHLARPHRDFNAPYSAYEEYVIGAVLLVKKFNNKFLPDFEIDDDSLSNPKVGDVPSDKEQIKLYRNFTKKIGAELRKPGRSFQFEKELIRYMINFLNFESGHVSKLNVTHNAWNLAARLLSALGDCLLIMCDSPSLAIYKDRPDLAFKPLDKDILNVIHNPIFEAMDPSYSEKMFKIIGKERDQLSFASLSLEKTKNFTWVNDKIGSRTELAIVCFGCSAICYNRANEVRNYAFQHKKILFTVKSFHRFFDPNDTAAVALSLQNALVPKIIEPLNKNRRHIIFPEHSKWAEFGIVDKSISPNVIDQMFDYYKFSYNTEVKLAILHWLDLYISDFKSTSFWKIHIPPEGNKEFFNLSKCFPINAYSSVNDQMVRLFELRIKSRYNRKVLLHAYEFGKENKKNYRSILEPSKDKDNKLYMEHMDQELFEMCYDSKCFTLSEDENRLDEIQFLVYDAIFCELRIIESINLNNVSYIKGYHYLAGAYLSLGWWVEVYQQLFVTNDEDFTRIKREELIEVIGGHEVHYVDNPEYAYRQSLSNYYDCLNVHSEGDTYQAGLTNMYFTEGDFNDDNQHFCAAIERWLINHKQVRRRIQFIKNSLEKESMFHSSSSI